MLSKARGQNSHAWAPLRDVFSLQLPWLLSIFFFLTVPFPVLAGRSNRGAQRGVATA